MSYFKDTNNGVHWLDDDSYSYLLPSGSVIITEEQAQALLAPTPAQIHEAFVASAQTSLDKTDSVAIRCLKAGVTFPDEWQAYVSALRNIVSGKDVTSTTLPTVPSYPSGT